MHDSSCSDREVNRAEMRVDVETATEEDSGTGVKSSSKQTCFAGNAEFKERNQMKIHTWLPAVPSENLRPDFRRNAAKSVLAPKLYCSCLA